MIDNRLRMVFSALLLALFAVAPSPNTLAIGAGNHPQVIDPSKLAKMPINYQRAMFVVVSEHGAAAVRFSDSFQIANDTGNGVIGVSYQWRWLSPESNGKEVTGSGRVFAKLVDSDFKHGDREIQVGAMKLAWRHNDLASGYIHFDASSLAVHPVTRRYFDDENARGNRNVAVSLKRFLYPDEEAAEEHRNEKYEGPETETRRYKGDTSGPVQYENTVVIVADPNGIATFQFGDAFDRQHDNVNRHYGVPYKYTLTSYDGEILASGEDEVYERYKNGQYDNGRLNLGAGPLHVNWSRGGNLLGWIYYDPIWTRVWCVDKANRQAVIDGIIASHRSTKNAQ